MTDKKKKEEKKITSLEDFLAEEVIEDFGTANTIEEIDEFIKLDQQNEEENDNDEYDKILKDFGY